MDAPFPQGMLKCIDDFLIDDRTRRAGQDIYPGVFETELFFPLQRKRELAAMMQKARGINPITVMEIGADKGGGLYHWCKSLPTVQRVIACEVRGTPYKYLFQRTFPQIDFLWIEDSSYAHATPNLVADWLGKDKLDCLFIDGDKGAFLRDFELYKSFVNSPGLVFMHDIRDGGHGGPRESFNQIATTHHTESIIDTSEVDDALDREEQGIPPSCPYEGWLRHWKGQSAGVGVIYL